MRVGEGAGMRKGGISMKQKVLNVFKPILFLAIGIGLFLYIQNIFAPNNLGTKRIIKGLDALEDGTIDVLCLGASHMAYGVSPMKAYKDTGVKWYNYGTGGQPLKASYYMAKKAFLTQSPKVVLLEATSIVEPNKKNTNERYNAFWRMLLENIGLNNVKYEMSKDYADEPFSDDILSIYFPIIKYHTRWEKLTDDDFVFWQQKKLDYSAGQYIMTLVDPATMNLSNLNGTANEMTKRNEGTITWSDGENKVDDTIDDLLYGQSITEENKDYVLRLNNLCNEYGAKLILVTIPTLSLPQYVNTAWTKERSDMMKKFAQELQIPYYDMVYDYDCSIDFNSDTADKGNHLNIRGADKVTAFLEQIIDSYGIEGQYDKQYDQMLQYFEKAHTVASLQSERDFYQYFAMLNANLDNWIICIAANNDYTLGMGELDEKYIENALGLSLLTSGQSTDSYVAVINDAKPVYEAVSNRAISQHMNLEIIELGISSSGWYSAPKSSIKIDNKEYAQGGTGLNIVVYDKESETIVDSVSFDTSNIDKAAYRINSNIDGYYRKYENEMFFN